MKKSSAYEAWKMLMAGLPRGIAMFVVGVVGLCLGLTLSIVGIGIPILAGTMAWCERRMREDQLNWGRWRRGEKRSSRPAEEAVAAEAWSEEEAVAGEAAPAARSNWRNWLATVTSLQGFKAIFYNIAQFPISLALFVVSFTIPVVVFALMLAPAAYKVSVYLYQYELFYDDYVFNLLLPPLTPFQRSLVVAGIGLFLLLFLAPVIRNFGRIYDGWVRMFASRHPSAAFAAPLPVEEYEERTAIPLH